NDHVKLLLSKTLMIVSTGVYFSTGWSYSTCLQYHYVADQKTWTEAQTYCRQTYADLATIGNKEQNDQLLDTITSAGQSSEVWMGLYSTIDWRWSDGFSGVGANYSNWRSDQPDFYSANEFCVLATSVWLDVLCSAKRRFVCYNENKKLIGFEPKTFSTQSVPLIKLDINNCKTNTEDRCTTDTTFYFLYDTTKVLIIVFVDYIF
uniref:C-type lectin domain-containing protein n=1 Tax=Gouania willdenowi TaxID=441366 RepID=A0A8C5E8R5_GOUWI